MKQSTAGDAPLITAAGDCRITSMGRWLRKTKVDELPQLFNVFIGDMSLVGPRPEVPKYTRFYTEDQMQIFLARPGITSPATLASVNEEETLARQGDAEDYYIRCLLPAKLELDLAYCRKITLSGDVRLIGRTLGRLLQPRNSESAEENKLDTNAEEPG
jgi:lipopolysaccharide/colanic/teichoic acid biosynthesis glycosyltransferase